MRIARLAGLLPTALVAVHVGAAGAAADAAAQRGLILARAKCGSCHALSRTGASPLAAAPPFRVLHRRYPLENLEEALAEGIVTGHPGMPEFRLDPEEIGDLIAFLDSLR